MNKTIRIKVTVVDHTEKSVKCEVSGHPDAFYLPKAQIKPIGKVIRNKPAEFDIPEWLWLKHRQLCGDEAFEAEKVRRAAWEDGRR